MWFDILTNLIIITANRFGQSCAMHNINITRSFLKYSLSINLNKKLKSTKIIFNCWFYLSWSNIFADRYQLIIFFMWKNQLCIIFLHYQKNLFVKKLLKLVMRNCCFFFKHAFDFKCFFIIIISELMKLIKWFKILKQCLQ